MWAYANINVHPGQEVMATISAHARTDMPSYSAQNVSNTLWAFARSAFCCALPRVLGPLDKGPLSSSYIHKIYYSLNIQNTVMSDIHRYAESFVLLVRCWEAHSLVDPKCNYLMKGNLNPNLPA